MNVLIVTGSVKETSGWGRHSRAIVEQLRREGVEVEVFAEETDESLAGPLQKLASSASMFAWIRNVRAVRHAAKKYDIVHALDGWPFGVYGFFAVLGTKKKLFINGVGTYSVAPLHSVFKGFLLRRVYTRAERIFCISNYTKRALESAGVPRDKMVTIYYGVPSLPVLSDDDRHTILSKYLIPAGASPIVLTVGAIKERKGQLDTLEAVLLLRKKYPNICYVMAGMGNSARYMDSLRVRASTDSFTDHLRIITDADDRTLAAIYASATVFALNSVTDPKSWHFEGFGAVVLEACQFGVPAVGSHGTGIEDAIADGVSGLLTTQEDPNDIADKLDRVLMDRDTFSRNATMRYTEFSWPKTVQAYIQHYIQ